MLTRIAEFPTPAGREACEMPAGFSVGTTGCVVLPCVWQDFQKIVVHGKPKEPERAHRAVFKPPSDVHLPTARLRLVCYDKTTGGMPLPPHGRPGLVYKVRAVLLHNWQPGVLDNAPWRADGCEGR